MNYNSFADSLEDKVKDIFATITATYQPISGDSVSCKIVIDKEALLEPDSYDAQFVETGIVLEAFVDEVGKPRIGSTFTAESVTYTVEKIDKNDGRFIRLIVT